MKTKYEKAEHRILRKAKFKRNFFTALFLSVFLVSAIFLFLTLEQNLGLQTKSGLNETSLKNDIVGSNPVSIEYNPANEKTYVADSGSESISIINASSNKVIGKIDLNFHPSSLAIDSLKNEIIIGGSIQGLGSVVVVDGLTNNVVENITIPSPVVAIAFDQENREIFAASVMEGIMPHSTLFQINAMTGSITSNVSIEGAISDIIYVHDNNDLYASVTINSSANSFGSVSVISGETAQQIATIQVGVAPDGLIYDPKNGDVYVANSNSSSLSVIDISTNKIIETIPVDIDPVSLVYDSSNDEIYITDANTGRLSIVDANTSLFQGSIVIGTSPTSITYDATNDDLYIANNVSISLGSENQGIVTIVSASSINSTLDIVVSNSQPTSNISLEGEIPVGGTPVGIAYDPLNSEMYVIDFASDSVSVINTSTDTVIANVVVGFGPSDIVLDPDNSDVYVVDTNSNNVVAISTVDNTLVSSISVGEEPRGIAYDPLNGELYVSNSGSNTVSVINASSNTVISTIEVGAEPTRLAYDPMNSEVYVVNSGSSAESSNIVSVINTTSNKVVENISVGLNPSSITVDTKNGDIFVAAEFGTVINGSVETPGNGTIPVSNQSSEIYVISGENNEVKAGVRTGTTEISSMTFDPSHNEVISVSPSSNELVIINPETNTVSQTTTLNIEPTAIAYDSSAGTVFVTSSSDSVVVLSL